MVPQASLAQSSVLVSNCTGCKLLNKGCFSGPLGYCPGRKFEPNTAQSAVQNSCRHSLGPCHSYALCPDWQRSAQAEHHVFGGDFTHAGWVLRSTAQQLHMGAAHKNARDMWLQQITLGSFGGIPTWHNIWTSKPATSLSQRARMSSLVLSQALSSQQIPDLCKSVDGILFSASHLRAGEPKNIPKSENQTCARCLNMTEPLALRTQEYPGIYAARRPLQVKLQIAYPPAK